MPRATSTARPRALRIVATLCLIVIGLQTAACGLATEWVIDKKYYFVEPSLVSLGEGRIPCEAEHKAGATAPDRPASRDPATTVELQASDTLVLVYTDCIKKMLRSRMNLARVARLTSSTFAVLTAAAAAALGAAAAAPLTAITALAAASAVTPEFMRIFGADERARAYDEGVHLIEEAEGQYLENRAGTGQTPVIPPRELTPAGAKLYVQVVASLKIVENLLVAQLPKIEEIQRAQGRVTELSAFQVQPEEVVITAEGQTARIAIVGGVVTAALSTNNGVVAIDDPQDRIKDGARFVTVKAGKPGSADVILINNAGRQQTVRIVVSPLPELVLAGNTESTVTAGDTITYRATAANRGPAEASVVTLEVQMTGAAAWKQKGGATVPSPGQAECAPVPDNRLRCSFGRVPAGVATVTIEAEAPANPVDARVVAFKSALWHGSSKPEGRQDLTVEVSVIPKVVLAVTETPPASVAAGTPFAYTVNVDNKGPSTAKTVTANVKLSGPAVFGPAGDAAWKGCKRDSDTAAICRAENVAKGTISFGLPATAQSTGEVSLDTAILATRADDKPADEVKPATLQRKLTVP